jgi:hypothetical protein
VRRCRASGEPHTAEIGDDHPVIADQVFCKRHPHVAGLAVAVQQNFGYTATWAGLVLTPGGIVTVFMMPLVGRLSGKVQPRYLIAAGAAICAFAMYDMTKINGDLG